MTHLEVTPEGIFVIENCPEEPICKNGLPTLFVSAEQCRDVSLTCYCLDYREALASCKRIRVSDQVQAKGLIGNFLVKQEYQRCHKNVGSAEHPIYAVPRQIEIKPGIYSLPDVEWERQGVCCSPLPPNINHQDDCDTCQQYSEVAILKESQQKDIDVTESQEDDASFDLLQEVNMLKGSYPPLPDLDILRRIQRKFTITRNK